MDNERNIFEVASRGKFRFDIKGSIGLEDLWDLTPKSLIPFYKDLKSKYKQTQETTLLEKDLLEDGSIEKELLDELIPKVNTAHGEELSVKIDIVKHIIRVKLKEEKLRVTAKERRQKKQRLLEALASKSDENLLNKTEEELTKMIEELND